MKRALCMALMALAASFSITAQAAVKASLDRDQISPGETVQLTLQRDGQGGGDPDLAPLKQDFEILGQSRSSNIQIINGKTSSQTSVQLTLAPRQQGKLSVPPITWGGEQSAALTLTVSDAPVPGSDAPSGAVVFIESKLATQSPYVQEAVPLTVQLYAAEPLYRASIELPTSPDLIVQQIGKDRQTETTRNGRRYQLVERDYLLFPQRSGALKLPGPLLNAQVLRRAPSTGDPLQDFMNQRNADVQPLRLHGDSIKLEVRPRPAAATAPYWLPARNLTLKGEWQPASLSGRVGEPLTLHLSLQAEGLTAAQLPELGKLLQLPAGLKAYPDQAKLNDEVKGGTVLGSREQDVALIAEHAGEFKLPELTLQWWDVARKEMRTVSLPAQTLSIEPAAAGSATANPAQPQLAPALTSAALPGAASAPAGAVNRAWQIAAIAFALLWLASMLLAYWLWRSAGRAPAGLAASGVLKPLAPDGHGARKAFLAACAADQAALARQQLLAWAQAHWPQDPPAGLTALAKRLPASAAEKVRELDRACYSAQSWQGAALAAALQTLPEQAGGAQSKAGIAPLYP